VSKRSAVSALILLLVLLPLVMAVKWASSPVMATASGPNIYEGANGLISRYRYVP
jgi:hypothetical protein